MNLNFDGFLEIDAGRPDGGNSCGPPLLKAQREDPRVEMTGENRLMPGYRDNATWRDMADYVVHFAGV